MRQVAGAAGVAAASWRRASAGAARRHCLPRGRHGCCPWHGASQARCLRHARRRACGCAAMRLCCMRMRDGMHARMRPRAEAKGHSPQRINNTPSVTLAHAPTPAARKHLPAARRHMCKATAARTLTTAPPSDCRRGRLHSFEFRRSAPVSSLSPRSHLSPAGSNARHPAVSRARLSKIHPRDRGFHRRLQDA